MIPDRFAEVEDAFHRVHEGTRHGRDRDEALREACGTDAELRAEVVALLDAGSYGVIAPEPKLSGLLDAPALLREATLGTNNACSAGTVLGNYKLESVIGEGGSGTVYAATQRSPSRRVAVKVLRNRLSSVASAARFTYEAEILARMDHPNIARIYDAGVADQTPYIAMELVSGVPITQCCDERRLPVRERLQLFMTVCEAVQHAHLRGVIHRDLKPANVLVHDLDGRPVPKVIDFGIAKTTGEPGASTPGPTQTGHRLGTPQYMSPEQLSAGAAIDTRADVYALGVMLYELLTGTPPYRASAESPVPELDVMKQVMEATPARPSEAVRHGEPESIGEWKAVLRGDLDAIVLKAIARLPEDRYQSAVELAQDLSGYLRGETVLARAPSVFVAARKWVARNRAVSVLACAAVCGLVFGVAAVARSQALESQRIADGYEQASSSHRAQGMYKHAISAAQLGLRAAQRGYGRESRQAINLSCDLGRALCDDGSLEQASAVGVEAYELARRKYGEYDDSTLYARQSLAHIRVYQKDFDGAIALIRQNVTIIESHSPGRINELKGAAEYIFDIAKIRRGQGFDAGALFLEAERLQRIALRAARATAQQSGDLEGLAHHLHSLSVLLRESIVLCAVNRLDEACALAEEALRIRRQHTMQGTQEPLYLYASLGNVGVIKMLQGEYRESEAMLLEAIKGLRTGSTVDVIKNRDGFTRRLAELHENWANVEDAEHHRAFADLLYQVAGDGQNPSTPGSR